jgi:membrane-bound lytic murein transglycosylase D
MTELTWHPLQHSGRNERTYIHESGSRVTEDDQPSMWTEDWAPRTGVPPIMVKSGKSAGGEKTWRFAHSFILGRKGECDISVEDMVVSSHHASIVWQEGQWWIEDNGSKNGTYLDGQKIRRAALPHVCKVQLGHNGPILNLEILPPDTLLSPNDEPAKGEVTMLTDHYFANRSPETMGKQTRLFHHAFQRVEKKHKKRYQFIIGIVGVLLLVTATALIIQSRKVTRLEKLHSLAEEIFYSMKSLELQMRQVQIMVEKSLDPKLRTEFADKQRQHRELQERYNEFAREQLGISQEKLTHEEWLIYKVARLFGECDVNMPAGFVQKVQEYIKNWQSSSRYRNDLARARNMGYISTIARTMVKYDMPPQFLYVAMQESDFDIEACGPRTRVGIAKGMWQFMPETGWKYNLRTGPLMDVRRPDQFDERHDPKKATVAAARYLRDLYDTEAQASGLLVIACYNWREDKILDIVRRMPQDPRRRNFWSFLKTTRIPDETYNYVFMIFSATVIGEDPRFFGFDFDNPLESEVIDGAGG